MSDDVKKVVDKKLEKVVGGSDAGFASVCGFTLDAEDAFCPKCNKTTRHVFSSSTVGECQVCHQTNHF